MTATDPKWTIDSIRLVLPLTKFRSLTQLVSAYQKHGKLAPVALVALIVAGDASPSDVETAPVTIGQSFSLMSEALGEERGYLVYLPQTYEDNKYSLESYPVLYVLDGGPLFHSATGVVQYMSSGINGNTQIPELIVVAVPNTNRIRDLTPSNSLFDADGKEHSEFAASGGADKFLQFFEKELIPTIESRYRTSPHRTLVGNSFGGLFAVYALLKSPKLFQAYIVNDPSLWWDDATLVRQAKEDVGSDRPLVQSVFLSSAGSDDQRTANLTREFSELLSSKAIDTSSVTYRQFEDEDHGSLFLPALYYGLRSIFANYDISFDDVYFGGIEVLVLRFEQLSARLNFAFLPPESLVDRWGQFALHGLGEPQKALGFFELNAANYPNSANAYVSLGDAYIEMGERSLAIASLERALEINPHHFWEEWTRASLAELRDVNGSTPQPDR